MPNLSALKRRIKSINSTLKTTAAMQLIASVKMRRAVEAAERSRSFAAAAEEVLSRLLRQPLEAPHPLLAERPVRRVTVVVVAADRGLCGSHNADIVRLAHQVAEEWRAQGATVECIGVGRQAQALARFGEEITASFTDMGESIEFFEASPVGRLLLDRFISGETDRVEVVYKKFVSTLRQKTDRVALVPVAAPKGDESSVLPYSFEPSADSVLEAVLPFLVRNRLFQLMLESSASEHAARMVAMQSATDAGRELVQDLVFTANTIRQEKITAEVAEITAGTAALQ